MVDEDTTNWDPFFSTNSDASGFEGTSPSADGYSAIGPSGGTYVTDVKLLGSQSMKFHVEGASSNCPVDNLLDYNAFGPEDGNNLDRYYRVYARWNTADDSWPGSHIKMLYAFGGGSNVYFQPKAGSSRPTQMIVALSGTSYYSDIPSGQLQNDRWYAMEMRCTTNAPYIFQAWVDGIQIFDRTASAGASWQALLFGIPNCCSTTSNFDLDHWTDGIAVSTSRIYPAAIIEIGDDSNYSTATKLQQVPIYLSDGSVQVKVDLTGLGSGPYYLWVTNNKQERSSYYQLQTDLATNPSPANSATNVDVDANLSWTAGTGATSHDVYFGTDSTPDSGESQGNQTATTFEPGTMSNSTTYYWRIDEVDSGGTTTGTVWNFTTEAGASPPGQATSPSPANSATGVSITADLSWTAGSGATSRDVYFGTSSPGTFQGNQTVTTYDAGTMSNDTTYYWRIDEINAQGTTTGNVWSFTTEAATTADVEIIGSWTSGTSHTEEAGTNRALIFTAHVESSADTSDLGSVTYGGQSMTKVVERNMHLSYSAYTCAFILDEAGIDAATSGTFSPSWNTSPSGTPAFTSVFLQNVNQTTLVGATGTAGTTTTTAETSALSTNDGDMAIVAGTCGNDAAYTTINSFTEAIEVAPSSADGIGGYLAATGSNVTPGVSHTNVNRQSVIGFIVKASTGGPTPPGQASNPNPANSATDVSITADLSWTAGSGATSHDVYFGTSSPGASQGNQTATTFDTGTMSNNTTYYWRIDEVNTGGTTTGVVWSFTTIVAAPSQASNPSPANSATDVSVTADLSWTAGSGATSHDVYFGTSSPGASQGNQTATTFDTGTMSNDTTYYWRIDEINAGGTTTGTVWSFTTIVAAPSQATNPSPANSATDVSITADLSWTAGSGATSHDVYFGTSSPGTFQGNQTATTFDTGTMSNNTTYYWRIDEVNAGGTTTGNVWSFTTIVAAPSAASSPSPANSATDVSITADLSWSAGSGATSRDVYFGTSSPGASQGNQTATTFDTGTMANNTTYYWRIDEINAAGTTTGSVWNFTTITSGQPVTKEFGDAVNTDYPGTVEDTFTNGDQNYSTNVLLSVYTWPANTIANTTIIKWDLSAIPTDTTVTEATLYLYQTDSGGDTSYDVPVHKIVNVNPVISACTWNTYDGTNSWTGGSDGGQGDTAAAEDTQDVNATNNQYKTWSVTNMVADWVSTPANNYGMLLNSDGVASVDSYRYFVSTEDSNTPYRPKLIVTYTSGGQASNPDPADNDVNVPVGAILSWTPGEYADTHDVYLGTDVNAVSDANQSSAEFMGNVDVNSYDPCGLEYATTYYWAIDEVNDTTTWAGDVWAFTTEAQQPPAQASSPSPADSATDVSITADFSWTAGAGATSHDVYFGTTSPGSFQGNQTATTFDTGTMANDTAYYWRIDEVNGGGTTTGTVWSFTTIVAAPGQASNPSPADSATGVSINADLSWTEGSGSTSSDVYFGTDSTPDSGEFQGNQTATTYEPGTLANGATYYWRIDEVNAGGTTTGAVWSFTTIVAVPGQASSPNPADTATDIAVSADLSWTAGAGSTSSDVYFGTTSPGSFQGNQTATTFDPGTMTNDTTYYWRIDEINAGGTTTGVVWSFTTEAAPPPLPGQASNPSPADSATDVAVSADLSWTAGSNATSRDVYFGTTSPGTFQGNQTAVTFDPGTMANDTTYYWRIDEINSTGTTTGVVWSFTTIVSTGDEIIGWWELNDASGSTAADSSTYNNDGTLVGSPAWTNDAEQGWCLDFSGEDNYVTIPNESDYDLTGNITVMAWMKASYVDWRNFSTIIAKGMDSSGGWALQKASRDNAMSFYVDVSGMPWDGIQAGVGVFDNDWHHVAGVYDGSDAYIYIDGGLDSNSVACSGSMATNNWPVYIGENSETLLDQSTNAREWDDLISDVRVYNYALTQNDINDIYTGGPTPPGQATNPSPANSATDVSITADLSWTAGSGSTSSDVYFGTTSPGASQGNQTATTFDPGTMSNDTTYYWRIDEINAAGTTTGTVWSFTTAAAPAGDVEIIGSWVSGTSHTEESGTNRLLVFTGHTEDNNADMNITSVTYGGQSMTKVVEQNVGTGYRAYVVAYVLDEAGINAASGSDFVVTWAETPSRSPGFSSVFLQNVSQSAPTAATDGNGTESSSTLATGALSTNDGDMVFVAGTCGNSGTYSVNNDFTEGIEISIASADAVAGYKAATGANETPSITHSNANRQVVIGFVVQAE
jgi:hypothetical protein